MPASGGAPLTRCSRTLTAVLGLGAALAFAAALPAQPIQPPDPDSVRRWLDQLDAPGFEDRQLAAERLYACGPAALPVLGEVASGTNLEAALQARRLMDRIGKLYFVGAAVRLELWPDAIDWRSPATLLVTFSNHHDYPIRLPFATADRELIDVGEAATQLGSALDVADFLEVFDPSGQRIVLTVDDLRGTPALERTLNHRVDYQPSAVLAPKESFTLPVPAINRGMARYRMLEAGGYTIRFRYVPEWETPGLVSAQAGLVSSAPATLTITQAAPQAVREGRGLVALHLQRSGDELIASLESTHDLPVSVNLGLGSPWNMYRAHLLWSAALAAQDPVAFPVEPGGRPDPQRLRVLAPGERAELARLSVDQLRDRLGGSVQQVSVSYMNLLDRRLLERSVPPGTDPQELQNLLERLPTPTFTGKVHSETVSLPPAQGQK